MHLQEEMGTQMLLAASELIVLAAAMILCSAAFAKVLSPRTSARALIAAVGLDQHFVMRRFEVHLLIVSALVSMEFASAVFLIYRHPLGIAVAAAVFTGFASAGLATRRSGSRPCGCLGTALPLLLTKQSAVLNLLVAAILTVPIFAGVADIGPSFALYEIALSGLLSLCYWLVFYATSVTARFRTALEA